MVALVALLVCMGLIAVILHGPLARMFRSRQELEGLERKLDQERETTRALEERKNLALSEEYVEWEARKMGYVKPGEIPLIVVDEEGGENAVDGTSLTAPTP